MYMYLKLQLIQYVFTYTLDLIQFLEREKTRQKFTNLDLLLTFASSLVYTGP